MSLRNVMRKAAGLLVEMPPEGGDTSKDEVGTSSTEPIDAAGEADTRTAPDIDELLAAVRGPKAQQSDKAQLSSASASPSLSASATPASGASTQTATQVAQSGPGPNLEQIKNAAGAAASPDVKAGAAPTSAGTAIGTDGKIQLPAVYKAAGVPEIAFGAEQALEIINSLPADLPLEVRRQTVKATLNAIGKTLGATPQTIVGDATRKLAALEAYVESFGQKSQAFTKKLEADIAALEAQIEEKRKAIGNAQQRVQQLSQGCDQEAERLDDVLEFFSLDVGPSKYAAESKTENKADNKKVGS